MRIYLDCCALNRPYDDLTQMTVNLEAQAKLHIQFWIQSGKYDLVSSKILMKEIDDCPYEIRRKGITDFVEEHSTIHVGPGNNQKINQMAHVIMKTGIKYKDACHIASAIIGKCDYFISTDKRLLKYHTDALKTIDPIQFVAEAEEAESHAQ